MCFREHINLCSVVLTKAQSFTETAKAYTEELFYGIESSLTNKTKNNNIILQ